MRDSDSSRPWDGTSHPRAGEDDVWRRKSPTTRQIYALAGALCEKYGEAFPDNRAEASELLERLRTQIGHPAPALNDTPLRPPLRRGRGRPAR